MVAKTPKVWLLAACYLLTINRHPSSAFAPPNRITKHSHRRRYNKHHPQHHEQPTTTSISSSLLSDLNTVLTTMDQTSAETLAGPFFGASLFPYLAFLFFLQVPQNNTPKGVTVGFATCLLFVFLTIPAAIAAKICECVIPIAR